MLKRQKIFDALNKKKVLIDLYRISKSIEKKKYKKVLEVMSKNPFIKDYIIENQDKLEKFLGKHHNKINQIKNVANVGKAFNDALKKSELKL